MDKDNEIFTIPSKKAELKGFTIERVVFLCIAIFAVANFWYNIRGRLEYEKIQDKKIEALEKMEEARKIKEEITKEWKGNVDAKLDFLRILIENKLK